MVKCKSLLKVFSPTRFPTAIEGSDVLIEYCSYSLVTLCNLNLKEEKQTKTLIETKKALSNWLEKCKERKWWYLFITSTVPFLVPSLPDLGFACLIWFSPLWCLQHLCHWTRNWVILWRRKNSEEFFGNFDLFHQWDKRQEGMWIKRFSKWHS